MPELLEAAANRGSNFKLQKGCFRLDRNRPTTLIHPDIFKDFFTISRHNPCIFRVDHFNDCT